MRITNVLDRYFFEGDGGAGSGSGGSGEGGSTETGGTETGGTGDKTFTQAELNAHTAREKAEGKRAGEKAVADQLGVSIEEAKKIIEDSKAKAESEKSEAQKATDAAAAREAAAAEREAAANRRVHDADVRDALREAGVKPERATKVSSMLTDVDVGADEAAIKAAVEGLKKEFPELFGVTVGGAPSSDPGKGPGGKPAGEDAVARGAERFKSGGGATDSYPILETT